MSPTNRHKYKYFHSTLQRAEDRRQKFHFCRLPFDVRPHNVKLNLSISMFIYRTKYIVARRCGVSHLVFNLIYAVSFVRVLTLSPKCTALN